MESTVLLLTQPHPWRPRYSFHTLFQNPLTSSHLRRSYTPKYRPWDSNAETSRSQRFGFNFRDKGKEEEEEEEEDNNEEDGYDYNGSKGKKKRRWWSDESSEMEEGPSGILEEAIDSVWIFKVFKSYGWALPIIIASLLLSSGPKAFLMALALPLGQSALSLAFENLWGRTQSKPKRKSRMRRKPWKPSASTVGNAKIDEEEKYNEDRETSNKKMGYQSWVAGNDVSVDNSGQDASSFGGWDDLERAESARRQSRRKPTGKGKLSQRERKSDTPLLFRLLIAVFPFLGSWTKIFW